VIYIKKKIKNKEKRREYTRKREKKIQKIQQLYNIHGITKEFNFIKIFTRIYLSIK